MGHLQDSTADMDRHGIIRVPLGDARYPSLLQQIADPPAVLYIRGNVEALGHPLPIAVVGTRKVTRYGVAATELLAGGLARAGACVVSGLALGTDGIAHAAALAVRGVTVAVLAGGVDAASVGPRAHMGLAERIIAGGGAIVSEHPTGSIPHPSEFLRRNRIVAGMSRGTIVVEAAAKSGALVTARAALDENRDVFAVPGPITSVMSAGTNALIARGGIPALSAAHVLAHYGHDPIDPEDAGNEDEKVIMALLAREAMSADEITKALRAPAREILETLTEMEIYGRVVARGGRYERR